VLGAAVVAAAGVQASAQQAAPRSYTPADVAYRAGHAVGPGAAAPAAAHMSRAVSRLLIALMDAAKQGDWVTAEARLMQARGVQAPSELDRFEIEVVASFVALNMRDHPTALASYEKVIASPLFATAQTLREQRAALQNAMVLSNEAGDYAQAIAFGEKLAASGPMDGASAVPLAFAYLAAGRSSEAQALAQKTIDADVAAGMKPDQAALEIVSRSKAGLH
jgi:tetratricopeptide (TPR) repeat protein